MSNDLALIKADELSLVEENSLNAKQLNLILKKTPKQYVKQRPAKGGGTWDYVTGGYVRKCLNLMFGWDWSFEILSEQIIEGEVVVKGKLTCRSRGKEIVKTQYGNKEIIKKKSGEVLSIGNDMKAAATDCLKKCAAEIGIAADIYNKEDFREVRIDLGVDYKDLKELYDLKVDALSVEEKRDAVRILDGREENSYDKLYNLLKVK